MFVYFSDSRCNDHLLGAADSLREAMRIGLDYVASTGFKSYYVRSWPVPEENMIVLDFGSHSEFLLVRMEPENGDATSIFNDYLKEKNE